VIVFRLEVSVRISEIIGKGVWFSIRFSSFLLYSVLYSNGAVETVKGCLSLKKYKSLGKATEVTVNSKEENS
jgi:hypothetical protein